MSRLSGSGGNVFVASQLIEDCEDAWNEQVDADVTASLDNTDYKVGSGSAKFVCAAGIANGDIIASEVVSSMDLTSYTQIMAWVKSSVNISGAGDIQILIDEHALCASPLALDVSALVANTWKLVKIAADFTGLDQVISVGLKLAANDPGAFNLWVDEIRAAKQVAGIKSWTIDYVVDALEVTGFDSSGNRQFVAGSKSWSGSFEGYKDGVPLSIGSIFHMELRESATATQQWRGSAVITGLHASVAVDGLVTYSYDFQGTDVLESATA
jgi:predicted secreted protein